METTTLFAENNPTLFRIEMNVPIADFIQCGFEALQIEPGILVSIKEDLDKHALEKKKKRLADAEWIRKQTGSLDLQCTVTSSRKHDQSLGFGRPRISPEEVYLFMILRGYLDSVTDMVACERIRDSITVRALYDNRYGKHVPAKTTIHENINAVSSETKDKILTLQQRMVLEEGLDDFKELTMDSTAVHANSVWPTDSGIIKDSLDRAFQCSQKLNQRYMVPNMMEWFVPRWLKDIRECDFLINTAAGRKGTKRKRSRQYRRLYCKAEKVIRHLRSELRKHRVTYSTAVLLPSVEARLSRDLSLIDSLLGTAEEVISYSGKRVCEGKSVPASEKVMSLSDGSAAMIKKGSREPVVGYRPQVCRSRNGFVTALHVPQGNAADSPQLYSMVMESIHNTGTVPEKVSADDGYSSSKGLEQLKWIPGVFHVSLSGSKGKALTGDENWFSEELTKLRKNRSAVESLMFILKYVYNFGKVRRRGIDAVRDELMEKAIAYNIMRMVHLRRERRKQIPLAS